MRRGIHQRKAYESGGYRERYAMDNGNERREMQNSHLCLVYTYSKNAEYQDANGATYDTEEGRWVN